MADATVEPRAVDVDDEHGTAAVPADVFVPAGIGGVLTDEVIDALDARAAPRTTRWPNAPAAERLARHGILYAPDFVIDAGGVIYLDGVVT